MSRYTKKELDELSDIKFAQLILREKLDKLENPYSDLSTKLRRTIRTLEEQEECSSTEVHKETANTIIKTKDGNIAKILKLIQENPDLPILPMVAGEIVVGDDFGYWAGDWGNARVDEYLIPKNGYGYIQFKSDDDVFDTLEAHLTEEEYRALPETEEECRPIYEALPWIKAIIIYIETP